MARTTSKPKVFVAVLTGGIIRAELARTLLNFQKETRAEITIEFCTQKPDEQNRNYAVKKTLDGDFDYMLMIDPDMVILRNPIDLVLLDLDIVGMVYPQWNVKDPNYPLYLLGMDSAPNGEYAEHKNKQGLQEVDAVGSGGLIVARRVLEKVRPAFERIWDENGFAILGIDFNFCRRAKKKGFKVWCHYDYPCDHIKDVGLLEVLKFKHGG